MGLEVYDDADRVPTSAPGMTPPSTTTDRPVRRTVLQVTPTPPTRVDGAVRGWGPELRRGLVQVVVAPDPPLLLRSRRANALVALASGIGAALLLVALVAVVRGRAHGATFVSPSGVTSSSSEPRTFAIAAVLSLLFLCVRYPLLAWRIGYVGLLFLPLTGGDRLPLSIAIVVCYWVAGLRHGRAVSWAMWLLQLLPVWLLMPGQERPVLSTIGLLIVEVALDATIVSRRAGHALAAQIAQSELEEAQRALLEERTRIAREMHDVVAHHMSLIAVQAETARYRLGDLTPAAIEEFSALSATARGALTDLRRLLGVLRSDSPAEREPQPQLADVATLVEATRRAGVSVELSMPTNGSVAVSHAVGLCAYRIVQEALSNAGRHAPGAGVLVTVEREPGALRLDVVNGPPTAAGQAPVRGVRPGHGISGMRERVALLGGSISAGPNAVGGFAVAAVLPLVQAAP
jgi:signal transduction histidine kinase